MDADKTLDEECLSDDDLARGNTFHFTPAGEASRAVDFASGDVVNKEGYARGVGLRRRGEGARWDSAALGMGRRGMPRRYGGDSTRARDSRVWTPLKNPAEMEYYRFSVASDPGELCNRRGVSFGGSEGVNFELGRRVESEPSNP